IAGGGAKIKIMGGGAASDDGLDFFWCASGFEINANGSELWAQIESDYNTFEVWISVWLDGVQTARLMLNKGLNDICLFRNLIGQKVKNVRVYKETQAMGDDGAHRFLLKSLRTDGDLLPVPPQPLKIEFIGDSITSGEGVNGAASEIDWTSVFFSATKTWAFNVAQALGADFNVISQSGWGVVCGYDGAFEKSIPKHYDQICSVIKDGSQDHNCGSGQNGSADQNMRARLANQKWDFSRFEPDYVIVNLGTNDQGPCERDSKIAALFEPAVIDFLTKIRTRNSKAQIVWCYGMMGRSLASNLERAVDAYKAQSGDERVQFVLLPEIDMKKTAALNHPSAAQQAAAAEFLLTRL
ncbi:MAG: hypothetical protein J5700_07785, partial [Treponema sp.]|nr:hypothetical protein [Treponema sp.]